MSCKVYGGIVRQFKLKQPNIVIYNCDECIILQIFLWFI